VTQTASLPQSPLPLEARTVRVGPRPQLKILGILGLFIAVSVLTTLINPRFLIEQNVENLIRRTALFGILGIGVAFVIITSGIDLSIGSVVALVGTLLPWLLVVKGWQIGVAIPVLLGVSVLIGLAHGLLITKLKLQPFVVTLCGLLMYRGIARGITQDQTQGFGIGFADLRFLSIGKPFSIPIPFMTWISEGNWSGYKTNPFTGVQTKLDMISWVAVPMPFLIMLALAIVAAIFLNRTVQGRYLLALGRNEQAARYSGINTDRMVILAYVICSLLAGFGGMLFIFEVNSGQPSDFGNFYELYAIAAAVLGGCSLRGGEGSIVGVVIGAGVMTVLRNSINMLSIPTQLEFAIIGAVILIGVVADELVKRYAAKRRAARRAG
jgi:ribose transport system permease protein